MKSSPRRAPTRRNSSTGTHARTAQGRGRTGGARRQGLLAAVTLSPDLDGSSDWARHHAGVIHNLKPSGTLEEALADRAALLSWKLNRVTRERDAAASGALPCEADPPNALARHEERRLERQTVLSLLESLEEPADRPLDGSLAAAAFAALKGEADEVAARSTAPRSGLGVPGVPGDDLFSEGGSWTTRRLRAAAGDLASRAGFRSWEGLWHRACARVWRERQAAEDRIAGIKSAAERLRQERLLRTSGVADEAARQESTLERSLFRTLHELEHLQSRRGEGPAPGPAAEERLTCPEARQAGAHQLSLV